MKQKNMLILKAAITVVVTMAFVLPSATAFSNTRMIGTTSNNEKIVDMETVGESTIDNSHREYMNPLPPMRGTIYVDDDRPPEWYDATHVRTIHEGVTNASAGDTIYVYNGTYYDHVTVSKKLNLVGESRTGVIVNGSGTGNVFYINTPVTTVNISNFSITNGQKGIYSLTSSNNSITNCNIYLNKDRGITLRQTSNSNIINCNIYNNTNTGIQIYDSSYNNNIQKCKLTNNKYGVFIQSSFNNVMNCDLTKHIIGIAISLYPKINNCTIMNCNVNSGGISLDQPYNCSVINTTSYNSNSHGIYINSGKYNIIQNCTVYNCTRIGIYVYRTSRSKVINCTASDNKQQGIDLFEATYNNIENCDTYNNTFNGIYLEPSSNNNNIANVNAYNNMLNGIYLESSSNNNITNCNTYNNLLYGIYFLTSSNNKLRNTMIYDNVYGLFIDGTVPSNFYHDIDPSNTINGKTIYYLIGQSNLELGETNNIGYLGLVSCTNITASNSDICGLVIVNTTHSTISNVNIHASAKGIFIWQSSYNNIIGCTSFNNEYGIYLNQASYNNITNCNVYDNSEYGIYLYESLNCKLRSNTIHDNVYNFGIDGTDVNHFCHDIDPSNTVNGKPIYYLVGQSNLELDETHNIGYLGLVSCINITAKNSDVTGILLVDTTDSTISNLSSHNNKYGIFISYSTNNNIMNCDASENGNPAIGTGCGIYLSQSSNNNIVNCNTASNYQYGISVHESTYNNLIYCNIHENSGFGFPIDSSSNINIMNCTFYNSGVALYFAGSSNCNITNCTFYNNWMCIDIEVCSYINIMDCNLYNNDMGIDIVVECSNINVVNCNISFHSEWGIEISWWSYNCNVINCNSYSNTYGIFIGAAWNVEVTYCTAYNNEYGIYVSTEGYGADNLIHHNNFFNNTQNVYCDESTNQWDDGSEGNFWGDYTGIDENGDGIGDTPYLINDYNQDQYPLMDPINNPPPTITDVIATPALQNTTEPINITCTVTDNWDMVDTVKIYISGPEGYILNTTMDATGNTYWYEDTYTILGVYFYYIWANDTYGREYSSDTYSFIITEFDKPTSAVNPLSLWKKTIPFEIPATAYDNSGVANVTLWYRYSTNATEWTSWTSYGTDEEAPWSWSFTSSDGYYQFYSIAVDDYGNIEDAPSVNDASTGIDTVKPVTTAGLTGTMGENNWYTSNVTMTLLATDTLSGVESTWYKIDAGYWKLYSEPFIVSVEGDHTVSYYSFDHAGNIEDTNSVIFKIDATAPTTTHTLDGVIGIQGWYVTNVTVTLSATDVTSGINFTKYKLNNGGWIIYTGSFIVTTDGNYTLYYYSVDFAGNTETIKQVEFKIEHDILPPVTTHEFNGIIGENDWFISTVIVTLNAVDYSADVAFTMYKLDAGTWTMYTGVFPVSEDAEHTLYYYSVDVVGNKEEDKSVILKIDQTAPTIDLTVEKTGLMEWLLTATVSDETSGIAKVEFYIDSEFIGEITESPYEFVYSGNGHVAQAIVIDNAGNEKVSDQVQSQVVPEVQSQSQITLTRANQSQNIITTNQNIVSTLQRLFNLQ